jgi:hypothetical protein
MAPQHETIVFDIDKNKMTPLVPELMTITRRFRETVIQVYWKATDLVKLRSRNSTSVSASFPKLKT